jgi:hypothetical protein
VYRVKDFQRLIGASGRQATAKMEVVGTIVGGISDRGAHDAQEHES